MSGPEKTQEFARLFMVPGMGDCGGGIGPNSFDTTAAIEQWVEKGKAPNEIIASRQSNGATDRTRPLCPYPLVAVWTQERQQSQSAKDKAGTITKSRRWCVLSCSRTTS